VRRPGHPSSPPHLNHVAQRLPADNPLHVIRPPLQRGAHLRHVVVPGVDAGDAGHTVPEHAFRDDVIDAEPRQPGAAGAAQIVRGERAQVAEQFRGAREQVAQPRREIVIATSSPATSAP